MRYVIRPHDAALPGRTALVLVNLGTPEAPDPAPVRRFLAEFLADPRVVEQPRWLWWLILNGVILRIRPRRSARAYAKVWTPEGSPLMVFSRRLAERLAARPALADVDVRLAMRYGAPSIASVLDELAQRDLRRVLVLPLYPQYSATTTASVFDAVFDALGRWRHVPELRLIGDYHAENGYVAALADSIVAHRTRHGAAEKLLFSFHGIPERYVRNGDPYPTQCVATAKRVAERVGLRDGEWLLSYQSRVGREPWLKPYTDETLEKLASEGTRSVQVIAPGFAVDCLETLEEIAMENRERFLHAGGERYEYITALNDSDAHVAALESLALRHLQGWPVSSAAGLSR
jgi:protoporphyrin/coproporphyrin ferrochelatase